jgi:hypothetical protein
VVAALSRWHRQHELAAGALAGVSVLPAHAVLEAYSVLTRLPRGLSVPAATAADVLARRFGDEPLHLSRSELRVVPSKLASAGVFAGGTYDGLVGLQAAAHGHVLLTLDERARDTYRRLAVPYRVIAD